MWRRVGAALSPPVALTRDGRRPLLAYPAKLAAMTANALADCQAVVILVDPDDARVPPLDTLRVAFGLSEADIGLRRNWLRARLLKRPRINLASPRKPVELNSRASSQKPAFTGRLNWLRCLRPCWERSNRILETSVQKTAS